MNKGAVALILGLGLMASSAEAETNPLRNPFFGFDLVLHPLAIKWVCGGDSETDTAALTSLISAFPEAAERADLPAIIGFYKIFPLGSEGLAALLGSTLSEHDTERLCRHALPLDATWMTPERLISGDDETAPDAWTTFYHVIEDLNQP